MLSMATSITPNSRSFPSGQVFYTWVNIRCKNLPWVGQDSVQINRHRLFRRFLRYLYRLHEIRELGKGATPDHSLVQHP
jgi:hypothetical protein